MLMGWVRQLCGGSFTLCLNQCFRGQVSEKEKNIKHACAVIIGFFFFLGVFVSASCFFVMFPIIDSVDALKRKGMATPKKIRFGEPVLPISKMRVRNSSRRKEVEDTNAGDEIVNETVVPDTINFDSGSEDDEDVGELNSPSKVLNKQFMVPESPSKNRSRIQSTPNKSAKPWTSEKYMAIHDLSESDFDDSDFEEVVVSTRASQKSGEAEIGSEEVNEIDNNDYDDDEIKKDNMHIKNVTTNDVIVNYSASNISTGTQHDHDLVLSKEQQKVVDLALKGKSMFYTGAAGTGKSFVLKEMVRQLRNKHGHEEVSVTATTGIASLNIDGETVHRWAGIRSGNGDWTWLLSKMTKYAKKRWLNTSVLIIDEISMMDGRLLDKLDKIGREVRNNLLEPFGGIQAIFTGDFFQLPPVKDSKDLRVMAFASNSWKAAVEETIVLQEVRRQNDERLIKLLNMLRLGEWKPEMRPLFEQLSKNRVENAVHLSGTRRQVEKKNNMQLKKLKTSLFVYKSQDHYYEEGLSKSEIENYMNQNFQPRDKIELKVGSQVMLVKNFNNTLVNGSIGKVITFATESTWAYIQESMDPKIINKYNNEVEKSQGQSKTVLGNLTLELNAMFPVVEFPSAGQQLLMKPELFERSNATGQDLIATRRQVPLILAWALSIHKSQGQTLPSVVVDCGDIWEEGQLYVALSRAVSFDQLQVVNFAPRKIVASTEALAFYESLT